MNITKIAVLTTFGKLIQLSNKNYVFPSQETLLRLLKQHYHINIKRRTLCYHLADLRKERFIKSIKRYQHGEKGTITALSSAVCLTARGCRLLFKFGSDWARRHLGKILHKFGWRADQHREQLLERKGASKPIKDIFEAEIKDPSYLKKYPLMRKLVEAKYGPQPHAPLDNSKPRGPEDPE